MYTQIPNVAKQLHIEQGYIPARMFEVSESRFLVCGCYEMLCRDGLLKPNLAVLAYVQDIPNKKRM
jgi:hypothetical protein